ncbi:MAG: thermonuclease family protein [Proteobacteria bacterium]|nr:thermonuclease family protein [Pseudomonadota bacterium]
MTPASVRPWLVALLLGMPAGASLAAVLHGQVVRVADGDTLTVADGRHRKIKVRLVGIDAPEKDQPYGREAKAHLASLVLGKAVDVEWDKRDIYGRVIGQVLVAPGNCPACDKIRDAGLAQISAGYAWWYRSESRELTHEEKSRYALAENAARARHGGLWAAPAPMPPWEWRHGQAGHSPSLLAKTRERIRKAGTVIRHPVRSARRRQNS